MQNVKSDFSDMLPSDLRVVSGREEAFLVGGSVRDFLLGKIPDDYDIVVLNNPETYAIRLAAKTKGTLVRLGKADMMVFRVVTSHRTYDISPPKGASLKDDLSCRDFTINALAADLSTGAITDDVGGIRDLSDKIVRMVSERSFSDDPLRLLRAFRMATAFDFSIEGQTLEAIRKYAPLISRSAGERIRAELLKIFRSPRSHSYLCQMADTNLLFELFPELAATKGCSQNRHHSFDVFDHTLNAFRHLEIIAKDADSDSEKAALLKFAILLHDIGKPLSRTVDEKGEVHFYGHEQKSADMATVIAERSKFSRAEIRFVEFVIRNHIRPLFLFREYRKNELTPKTIARFFMKCGEYAPFLLLHAIADFRGKGSEDGEEFAEFGKMLLEQFRSRYKPQSIEAPLITGYDLISEFGLAPSPLFKKILTMIEEERLSGNLKNREQASERVREFLCGENLFSESDKEKERDSGESRNP